MMVIIAVVPDALRLALERCRRGAKHIDSHAYLAVRLCCRAAASEPLGAVGMVRKRPGLL